MSVINQVFQPLVGARASSTWLRAWILLLSCCSIFVTKLRSELPEPIYLSEKKIHESSGIAASYRNQNIFWTHNDSGDQAQIFAFNQRGEHLGGVKVRGAEAIDWEDMCCFQWHNEPWILIADTGDNDARRKEVVLYAFPEPDPVKVREVQVQKKWRIRYADGPRDCEAVSVDVDSNLILLMDKSLLPKSQLWSIPLDDASSVVTAKSLGWLPIPTVTSMDYHAATGRLLINTYADAILVQRQRKSNQSWETWSEAFTHNTTLLKLPQRKQGEAICFTVDGTEMLLTSEGTPCPLWRLRVAVE